MEESMAQDQVIEVADNPATSQYEMSVDGKVVGLIQYENLPGRVVMLHAEIDPALEGQGLASRLAETALNDVESRGLKVVPACPFVKGYIQRHPEWHRLVYSAARDARASGEG
jgi:hypothetical protein